MAKILFVALVALVFAQSNATQSTLKSVFDGFEAPPIIGLLRIQYNPNNLAWGSIFDDLMTFIQSTSIAPLTSLSKTVTGKLSSSINVALGSLSSQAASTNEDVLQILEFMASQNLTQRSYSLSSYALTLYTQSVSKISSTVFSLATVLGGQKASCHRQVETVDQQARAFVSLSTALLGQIQESVPLFIALNQEFCGESCDCLKAADTQALIDEWSAIIASVSRYFDRSCRKWSLSQYLSKSSSNKIAKAINDTNDFLKGIKVCADCIFHNIPSDTNAQICNASNTDALDNIASSFSTVSIDSIFTPKRSLVYKVSSIADAFRKEIDNEINLAKNNLKKSSCSKKRRGLNDFIRALSDIEQKILLTNDIFTVPILGNISEWSEAAVSAAQPIIAANKDLASTLIADNETCTTCLSNTNITFNQFEFVSALKQCGEILDAELNKISSNVVDFYRRFINKYVEIALQIDACSSRSSNERGKVDINARCIERVAKKINQVSQQVFTEILPLETSTFDDLKTADEQFEICLLAVSTEISTKIAEQKTQFLNCKAIIPLIPAFDAAILQLDALLGTVLSTAADPACLEPIRARITELLTTAMQTNLYEHTPEIVTDMIYAITSTTAALTTKLEECIEKSKELLMCMAFSSLLPHFTDTIDSVKALIDEMGSSDANASCLDPLKAQAAEMLSSPPKVDISNLNPVVIEQLIVSFTDKYAELEASFTKCVEDSAAPVSKYPLPNTCVTWKPYLNDAAPATDGFLVGKYTDNSDVYVGYAYVPGQNSQPGRLRIDQPALYLTIPGTTGTIINKNVYYMAVSTSCECTWETLDFNTPGVIMLGMVLQDGPVKNTPFFVSKIDLGSGAVTVARSRLDFNAFYYGVAGNEATQGSVTTALACNPKSGMTPELQTIDSTFFSNTLQANQCLFFGHSLVSASRCFSLTFQVDGNVVLTRTGDPTVLYSTNTANKAAFQACLLKTPGNFVVYGAGEIIFDTKTSGATRMVLEDDGNLVVYAGATNIWSSQSTQAVTTC